MREGRGGTFSEILITLNAAKYATTSRRNKPEKKDEVYESMQQTWECLIHLGRFTTREALTTSQEMVEMLDLWEFAVHRKGGLLPMHNDYSLCEAWDTKTLDQIEVVQKGPSKATQRKVSKLWRPRSNEIKRRTKVQGEFPSIKGRLQTFGS